MAKKFVRRSIKGFTLIELLVVVLIIGVLVAIGLPKYNDSVRRAKLAEANINLKSFAQAIRMYQLQSDGNYSTWSGFDTLLINRADCIVKKCSWSYCVEYGQLCCANNPNACYYIVLQNGMHIFYDEDYNSGHDVLLGIRIDTNERWCRTNGNYCEKLGAVRQPNLTLCAGDTSRSKCYKFR